MSNINAKDVKRLMIRTFRKYQNGQITIGDAYKESSLLGNILKAIEVSDTEERLSKIENLLKGANEDFSTD